jgi:hypothetical protein
MDAGRARFRTKSGAGDQRLTPGQPQGFPAKHRQRQTKQQECAGLRDIVDARQKAIDFTVAAQNPGKAWRYSAKCGDNDSSVSGWAVMALKSAELSELSFPKSAYEGALNWFNEATEQNGYYQVGYNARSTGKVYVPGKNEQFDHHASMSAVAVMSRIFMQKKKSEPALGAVNLLVADLPEWKTNKIDFYYWYYSSLALFQFDGPEGPMWKKWNEPMKNALVPNQKTAKDGCQKGSWDPAASRWGLDGGRVWASSWMPPNSRNSRSECVCAST